MKIPFKKKIELELCFFFFNKREKKKEGRKGKEKQKGEKARTGSLNETKWSH